MTRLARLVAIAAAVAGLALAGVVAARGTIGPGQMSEPQSVGDYCQDVPGWAIATRQVKCGKAVAIVLTISHLKKAPLSPLVIRTMSCTVGPRGKTPLYATCVGIRSLLEVLNASVKVVGAPSRPPTVSQVNPCPDFTDVRGRKWSLDVQTYSCADARKVAVRLATKPAPAAIVGQGGAGEYEGEWGAGPHPLTCYGYPARKLPTRLSCWVSVDTYDGPPSLRGFVADVKKLEPPSKPTTTRVVTGTIPSTPRGTTTSPGITTRPQP